jgi:tRNA(Ile)-lysidine synthase
MRLLHRLATVLDQEAVRPGDGIVVAFSGGADSTALLYGLTRLAPSLGIELHAAHLDHALDAGSPERAAAAAASAARLGVECTVERRPVEAARAGGAGLEAEARSERYRFLEEVRSRLGFRFVATAHHRDDQAETVMLRMDFGSGVFGLGAIERRRGALLRPLLDLDRAELRAALVAAGLGWIEDPTNHDERPRHRQRLLLEAASPELSSKLASIADRARLARPVVDWRLGAAIDARGEFDGASASLSAMRSLPSTLLSTALATLHRRARIPYPASRRATVEIERQMRRGGPIGCDCGRGFGWEVRGPRLHLARRAAAEPYPVLFTYTLTLPGDLLVEELSLRFRLVPAPEIPREFEITPRRAALALPNEPGNRVTVRNRRPGDRIRPLGWDTSCRVKDLLINRKVKQQERWRLPFVVDGENVIWIPGVTIDERYRATPGNPGWIAEIEDLRSPDRAAAAGELRLETPLETLRIAR